MDAKKILAELLQFGCIKEGREKVTLGLLESYSTTNPGTVPLAAVLEALPPVSAADLDAVADEQKAADDTKGTVN